MGLGVWGVILKYHESNVALGRLCDHWALMGSLCWVYYVAQCRLGRAFGGERGLHSCRQYQFVF